MLKITYTETGLHLEYLSQAIDAWVALRLELTARLGQHLHIEHCTASFLLPTDLAGLHRLRTIAHQMPDAIALAPCDAQYLEVSLLRGTWVASMPHEAEGVFLVEVGAKAEASLLSLWLAAQSKASPLHNISLDF